MLPLSRGDSWELRPLNYIHEPNILHMLEFECDVMFIVMNSSLRDFFQSATFAYSKKKTPSSPILLLCMTVFSKTKLTCKTLPIVSETYQCRVLLKELDYVLPQCFMRDLDSFHQVQLL